MSRNKWIICVAVILSVILVIVTISWSQYRVDKTCEMELSSNFLLQCQNFKPEFDKEDLVKFYWYSSSGETEIFLKEPLNLPSDWKTKKSLKIITHGFQSSSRDGPGPPLKSKYLAREDDYNVILVDWGQLTNHWLIWNKYCQSARNTEVVGKAIGKLIKLLVSQGVATYDNIHLIGHSLGGHASGIAGEAVGSIGKVGRITALDPAGPSFYPKDGNGDLRLSPDDASFVDVIHTDADTENRRRRRRVRRREIIKNLGYGSDLGHADFYPNGGREQPACTWEFLSCCSHSLAYKLMAETVLEPHKFPATNCENYKNYTAKVCDLNSKAHMGEHASPNAKGKYFLITPVEEKQTYTLEILCSSFAVVIIFISLFFVWKYRTFLSERFRFGQTAGRNQHNIDQSTQAAVPLQSPDGLEVLTR